MPIIHLSDFTEKDTLPQGTVLILGYFDGVHKGHRALITEAASIAAGLGGRETCAWTFDSMPKAHAKSLTTTEEKCRLFAECGVDYVILEDFESLKSLGGRDFFTRCIADKFAPAAVVCGFNFTFGNGASCTAEDLCKMAESRNILCSVVEEQSENGEVISSSRIRRLIESGRVKDANLLIESPYSITSVIEHGVQIGRKMGVRTINQRLPKEKVHPKNGVYCCSVTFEENGKENIYGGVCNIGHRPTVNDNQSDVTIETHIFDFDGEIYGKCATVKLYEMLREEKKFADIDSLRSAIEQDVTRAKELLKNIL